MTFSIVDVGEFHCQVVCLLQFRIVFENDVCPPLLRVRPLGLVFGEYELCPCQQLSAGIAIGIPERFVLLAPLPGLLDLLILQVARHPAVSDTHVIQGIVVEFLYMEPVVGDACLGKYGTDNEHHRGRQVERDLPDLAPTGTVKQLQYTDDVFRLGSPDDSHQRTRSPMTILVCEECVKLAV